MNGYIIKRSEWNVNAAMHLLGTTHDDPFMSLDDIALEVQEGKCALFDVHDHKANHIASFVIRIDESYQADELVVIAAAGQSPRGQSLCSLILPYIIELARKSRCSYVRAHTKIKGMVKLMENAGYKLDEYICRVEVT